MLEPRAMAGHQTVVNGARGNQEGSGQDSTGEAENRTLIPDMGGSVWHRLGAGGSGCSLAILKLAPGPEFS